MTNPVGITTACSATAAKCSERFFKINGVMTKNDVLKVRLPSVCQGGENIMLLYTLLSWFLSSKLELLVIINI